ncbi:MAG: hypothetical protein IPH13_20585 [Planctomycetes bacterium]|nr:hypothetical protein [Planctomycetota bacterium]
MEGLVEHIGIYRGQDATTLQVDIPFGGRTRLVTIQKTHEKLGQWRAAEASMTAGQPITVRLTSAEASRLGLAGF